MFEIDRSVDSVVRNYYNLRVDEKYVERVNTIITSELADPTSFQPLTIEDIRKIFEMEDDCRDGMYMFKVMYDQDRTYVENLDIFVRNIINDDLWDSWVDSEEVDEYDVEDEVIEL